LLGNCEEERIEFKDKYDTTLYVASIYDEAIPTRHEVRHDVWNHVREVSKQNALDIVEERQIVSNEVTEISFTVMDVPTEKVFLLSFQPGDSIPLGKTASENAAKNVLAFCDILGSEIRTSGKSNLRFKRKHLSNQDRIHISEWKVTCPFTKPPSMNTLMKFVSHSLYENVFQTIPREIQFHVFSQTYSKDSEQFRKLRENIGVYGKVLGPKSILTAKEFCVSIADRDREKAMFVFLEDTEILKKYYSRDKFFFDNNHIPTQYVSANTVESKLGFFRVVDANLILEMMTKMGKQPIVLNIPEGILTNDGFLCLSDIPSVSQKLFGAIFTYSKQRPQRVQEDVQIYNDIKFETPKSYSLEIDEDNIILLADKIKALVGRRINLDILLTRRWKKENFEKLVESLHENSIVTKRAYYVSSKTARFVDSYLLDPTNYKSLCHPYLIIGDKLGFLKTCTDTRIYPNLFSLFVEIIYPSNSCLSQNDLEKLLWLSKKRLYRIQEFYVLKNLEPIYVFKNLKKMYLTNIGSRLTIPLRLLI
jgi:hypothetical protein